ncbi:hypothetical protein [Undibacterium sp. SXout20W]|uniref:hypothetical protein n=1 Tax=Undibacterium sp. SXout20W TaxID=3413051 RepID=UPI003BF12B1E
MIREDSRRICRRHFGIATDGMLYGSIEKVSGDRISGFNTDAGECKKSQNRKSLTMPFFLDK